MRPRLHCLCLALLATLLVSPSAARAQTAAGAVRAAPAVRPVAEARVTGGRVVVDGRLDDAAWAAAAPVGGFRQQFPVEGAAPSQPTEVRVLFDDATLLVGARLRDAHPDSIARPLGRRDAAIPADAFAVAIDAEGERRTAFVFRVSAAGVQRDGRIANGAEPDDSWNAVWDAAVHVGDDGWSVEIAIPFHQLRVGRRGDSAAAWGVNFTRWITRTNETVQWALVPRTAAVAVPHYGELRGLDPRGGRRVVELLPFVLAQVTRRPDAALAPADDRTAFGRSAGLDLRTNLTPSLRLVAAVNPDFGQVEADPSFVNLTAFEQFQQERRPFFVDGAELFAVSTSDWFDDGELFYSRRVGRAPQGELPEGAAAPAASSILSAAKLVGRVGERWSVGLLDVVTDRERVAARDAGGATRPATVEPLTHYAMGRAQRSSADGRTVLGLAATSTLRRLDGEPRLALLRRSAHTGGVDLFHRFADDEHTLRLFAFGSRVTGSPAAITATQRSSTHLFQRPDADHLALDTTATAMNGLALQARAGKFGGRWRWQGALRGFSPGFESNDLGFQPRADYVVQFANVGYARPEGGPGFRDAWAYLNQWTYWTTGRERLGADLQLDAQAQLRSWWTVRGRVLREASGLSVEDLRGGPSLRTPSRTTVDARVESDPRRPLSGALAALWAHEDGTGGRRVVLSPTVAARPSPRLDASVALRVERTDAPAQYLATRTVEREATLDTAYVVGALRQTTASLTVRGTIAFSPRATLELYAQPFLGGGRYGRVAEIASPHARRLAERVRDVRAERATDAGERLLRVDRDLDGRADYALDDPDFARRELNATIVYRWEYRPASTLFVVWTHQRDASGLADLAGRGGVDAGDDARRLLRAPGTSVLLVKLSHWLSL